MAERRRPETDGGEQHGGDAGTSGSVALFTVEGVLARVLRALLGTVFLAVGLYLVIVAGDLGEDAVVGTAVGALFTLVGVYSYVQAVRKDTFRIVVGDSRERHTH